MCPFERLPLFETVARPSRARPSLSGLTKPVTINTVSLFDLIFPCLKQRLLKSSDSVKPIYRITGLIHDQTWAFFSCYTHNGKYTSIKCQRVGVTIVLFT